jgi:hypothetical protein
MTKIVKEAIWLNDINGSLERTKKYLPEHYVTLWGERGAGSKWGFELTLGHINGDGWKLVQGGPVRIYEKESEHEFTLGVQPLDMTDKSDIRIQEGPHGPELVMDSTGKPQITSIMTLIIGPEEDCGDVVFTIHPGEATPPHGCRTVEELHMKLNNGELDPKTSVKFV